MQANSKELFSAKWWHVLVRVRDHANFQKGVLWVTM
jgi:hypothetical protein